MINNETMGRILKTADKTSALASSDSSKFSKFSAAVSLIEDGKDIYDRARSWHRARTTWTVKISQNDPSFRAVETWLMDRIPAQELRAVEANTTRYAILKNGTEVLYDTWRNDTMMFLENPNADIVTRMSTSMGTTHTHNEIIDGHAITVQIYPNGAPVDLTDPSAEAGVQRVGIDTLGGRGRRNGNVSTKAEAQIVFTARSIDAKDSVIEFLNQFSHVETKKSSNLYVADSWGEWSSSPAPRRGLDTVITAEGVVEDIRGDLKKFLDDEQKYIRLGLPWHRGYLLHGPPGTGKTSLVKAVANDLGMDLWYLSMGDIKDDSGLLSLVRSVRSGGILLIEDIDSFSPVLSRENNDEGVETGGHGVSTSALLNALDGVTTPHGLITIMTTNYIDRLDDAILRSGRADRVVEMGLPSWREIQRLWTMFYPEASPLDSEPAWFAGSGVSQADISEIFKRYWENSDTARVEIMNGLGVRVHG